MIGDEVGGVSLERNPFTIGDENRIVVAALADQHLEMIEPGGSRLEVPFTNYRSLVTRLPHQLWHGLLGAVKSVLVGALAIEVRILAGENYGPRGSANGVGHQTAPKQHAFLGDAIQVGGIVEAEAIGAQCLRGVVVGKQKQYVRPLRFHHGGYEEAEAKERAKSHFHAEKEKVP